MLAPPPPLTTYRDVTVSRRAARVPCGAVCCRCGRPQPPRSSRASASLWGRCLARYLLWWWSRTMRRWTMDWRCALAASVQSIHAACACSPTAAAFRRHPSSVCPGAADVHPRRPRACGYTNGNRLTRHAALVRVYGLADHRQCDNTQGIRPRRAGGHSLSRYARTEWPAGLLTGGGGGGGGGVCSGTWGSPTARSRSTC